MTFNYILPDTPDDILTSTGTDIFAVTIGSLSGASPTVLTNLQKLAWAKYRFRPIGDYDYEHWMIVLQDVIDINWDWYLQALPEYVTLGDLNDSYSTATTVLARTMAEDSVIAGANTGTVTITNQNKSGTIVDSGTNSSTTTFNESTPSGSTVTGEVEDHPDTAAGATKYVNQRTLTTSVNTGSHTGTLGISGAVANTRTNTELVENKTVNQLANTLTDGKDVDEDSTTTVTQANRNNMKVKNFNIMTDEIKKASMAFINTLDPLFMNRW